MAERSWIRDKRVQIGGSIVMSLAALACNPKDTIKIVPVATELPPVAGVKINAERTLTPTVVPTLAPEVPVIRDAKSDTPTPTATATEAKPSATPTAEPTPVTRPTQGSDTPVITPPVVPTVERTPQPTKTPTRTPEATPTKTAKELDSIYRQQVEVAINQYFFEVNRRNMGVDPVLSNYAQACADFLAAGGLYSHSCKDQPQIIGIINAGWRGGRVNENLEFGPSDSSVVIRTWENSPPHNAAMIDSANKAYGVGCSTYKTGLLQNYGSVCVAVFGQ